MMKQSRPSLRRRQRESKFLFLLLVFTITTTTSFTNAFGIVSGAKSTIRRMTTLHQRAVAEIAEKAVNGGARVTPDLESLGEGASILLNETEADLLLVSDNSPFAPPLTYSKFITMRVSCLLCFDHVS
jgi:hypothetical protein